MNTSYIIEVISYDDIHTTPKIHQFSVRNKYFVNSVIIETENHLVIFDAQQDLESAQQLISYAKKLDKPIERLIISHAHIDHYAGMPAFDGIPSYSSEEVILEAKDKNLDEKYIPKNIIESKFSVDNINFEVVNIKNAHCPNHVVIWIAELKAVLVGDLAQYNGHLLAYNYDNFILGLEFIKEKSLNYKSLLTGHGYITTVSILTENIEYLNECRKIYFGAESEEEFDRLVRVKFPNRSKIRASMGLLLHNPSWKVENPN